jgi:hypothetical protein
MIIMEVLSLFHPECSPCVGAAYYAVHIGAAQVVAHEGATVSEQGKPPSYSARRIFCRQNRFFILMQMKFFFHKTHAANKKYPSVSDQLLIPFLLSGGRSQNIIKQTIKGVSR